MKNFEFDCHDLAVSLAVSCYRIFTNEGPFLSFKISGYIETLKSNYNTTTEITGKRKIIFCVQKTTYIDRIYINLQVNVNKAVYSS